MFLVKVSKQLKNINVVIKCYDYSISHVVVKNTI